MVYKFFHKKSASLADKFAISSGVKFLLNQQLANELHKAIIEKAKRKRVYSSFEDNIIQCVELADMQLISK